CSQPTALRQRCWGSVRLAGDLMSGHGLLWTRLDGSPAGRSARSKPSLPRRQPRPPGLTPPPRPAGPPPGPPPASPPGTPGPPLRPPPGPPLRPPPGPFATVRPLRSLCTGDSAPTSKAHPSHPSSPSTGRRPPVSDEWITDEQVVAQAVAPFVETVGDAVEAATAVLAAVREAGFEWYPVDRKSVV